MSNLTLKHQLQTTKTVFGRNLLNFKFFARQKKMTFYNIQTHFIVYDTLQTFSQHQN